MTSDETQNQIFADWPMSHAKRVITGQQEKPEYHVVAAIRKLRTDKNCPAETGQFIFGKDSAFFNWSGIDLKRTWLYDCRCS